MPAQAPTLHNGEARFTFFNTAGEVVANDSGQVHAFEDAKTGLIWGDTLPKTMTAIQSDAAAADGKLLGESARLPTLDELETLRDITTHDPATFPELAALTKSSWYRTSSVVSDYSGYRWCVDFYDGSANAFGDDSSAWVRLVRGPVAALPRQSSAL